jgi:6-phosphogluconate dehydrogenase
VLIDGVNLSISGGTDIIERRSFLIKVIAEVYITKQEGAGNQRIGVFIDASGFRGVGRDITINNLFSIKQRSDAIDFLVISMLGQRRFL